LTIIIIIIIIVVVIIIIITINTLRYGWASHLWSGTLHSAAYNGDVSLMTKLLAEMKSKEEEKKRGEGGGGSSSSSSSSSSSQLEGEEMSEGATPLLVGTAHCHLDIVKACIEAKSDVNVIDRSGRTPLSLSHAMRRIDIAAALLEAKASPLEPQLDGKSMLFAEATRGGSNDDYDDDVCVGKGSKKGSKAEWMLLLLKHKALPFANEVDALGNNILHRAILSVPGKGWGKQSLSFLAKYCLRSVRKRNKEGLTPLHLAAKENNWRAAKTLLSYGAHPNARHPKNGRTALHFARTPEVAEILIMGGARVDLTDKRKERADKKIMSQRRFKNRDRKLGAATSFWSELDDSPPASDLVSSSNSGSNDKDYCVFCWERFSMMRWKYNCARCQLPVCSNCSSKSAMQPSQEQPAAAGNSNERKSTSNIVQDDKDNRTSVSSYSSATSAAAAAVKRRVCDGCYNLCRVRAGGIQRAWGIKSEYDEKRARLGLGGGEGAGGSDAAFDSANQGIAGTKNLMNLNILAAKERGEKLNELNDKTAQLSNDAKDYASTAKALRRKFQKQARWPFG